MGIFSRITDIIESNVNAMLDRAEDPEKIIRLIIQEMEDTLVEVRSATVRTIAEQKEMRRRRATLEAERDEWQRKAEFALLRDREDLAKGALTAKARLVEALASLERQIAQIDDALAKQSEDIAKLQAKLTDAKARERTLALRAKTANNRLKVRASLYDERIVDAFARFEQVERTLDHLEGKVEAYDVGRPKTLEQEFGQLETDSAVADELAALKQRLHNGPKSPVTP